MKLWLFLPIMLLVINAAFAAPLVVDAQIDRPLIADIQQCFCVTGTTNNKDVEKNTTQFSFVVKTAATELIFPFAQTYSSWNESELQIEFDNEASYRAAISVNKGAWTQLTWDGKTSKTCAFRATIINDPLPIKVKVGDKIYIRTEISVPKGGKWGNNVQAREWDENNWKQGAVNTADDVLLSENADFSPQSGLFIHTALGVFGKPVDDMVVSHPTVVVGDSIAPYVLDAALQAGNLVPVANVFQPAETAERFARAGQVRQSLFAGCDTLLYEDGINDMRNRGTFEELKASSTKIWDSFREKGGKRLVIFTLTPLTRSVDKWTTEAGQSPEGDATQRQQWNEYVRKLSAEDVQMALVVIDTAKLLESSPESCYWKVMPDGVTLTDDGVHPNSAGYTYLAQQINPLVKEVLLADIPAMAEE